MGFVRRSAGALLLAASLTAPGAARGGTGVCINEICYDPDGPDEGREFVEIHNGGDRPVALEGWWLEAGNGAAPGDWRLQWVGQPGDRIAAGGFFLIADREVALPAGVPAARARLALQNGPDAVRLCRAGGTVDRVGWGAHLHPEFYDGAPALDPPGGQVLARIPDGADTGCNARDLRARARATPGLPNAPPGALWIASLACEPPVLGVGAAGRLVATLINEGLEAIPLASIAWRLAAPGLRWRAEACPPGDLAPGAEAEIAWAITAPDTAGCVALGLAVHAADGPADSCRRALRIGHGPILISELQYDPREEEGEWVELYNAGETDRDLAGWQLRDRSGQATTLVAPAACLPAGGVAVVARDPAAVRRRYPELTEACLLTRRGSWPSLNNRVAAGCEHADQVDLLDPDLLLVDYVRYAPGDLDGDGVSLERWIAHGELIDPGTLLPCPVAAGATPGRLPSVPPRGGSSALEGELVPQPFYPDRPGSERLCALALPAPPAAGARLTAEIFALDGRRLTTLTVGARVSGPTLLAWDGRDASGARLPTGLYLVRAFWHAPESGPPRRWVRPLVLVRG